ncbi:T9SS type A sorting domain-containing protein [Flavobacterium silvaticum]|uniref:T9SS type A sorting domain-containing protein n=1 Tax=Flavobacterium silvaticum TaxID=1852020 RepID=A0A972FQL3_9FLAO|nr:T9SS type A sorting domain-containing protein [Flavobacterium silvaticum]NMH29560.1 T9SS type A sorting domain-containing protein [Flavobacterium silvaticum]
MKLKLRYALLCAVLGLGLVNQSTHAQGFGTTPTNWGVPAGGETYSGTNYSFRYIGYVTGAVDNLGSQSWTVADMNGDSKLDLVVYNENQADGDAMVFSQNLNPYWKVYLGTSSGFSTTATNWALPPGGEKYNGVTLGYHEFSAATGTGYDIGSQSYQLMDMNGDAKPDMVVYAENMEPGMRTFSNGSSFYWKVYLNTGSGFSQTATNWTLPAGGEKDDNINYSFRQISDQAYPNDDLNSESWTVMDMNGDAKPDLVVYSANGADDVLIFSSGATKYWKVFLNTGSGFSTTATNWNMPAGGEKDNNMDYSFRHITDQAYPNDDLNSESWTIMDMNGDSKPDLVVYSSNGADDVLIFNSGATKYWKVFLNTGSGFSATATNWTMPAGGEKDNNTDYSFRHITDQAYPNDDLNSESWTVMDMNGDAKPDLVVYSSNGPNEVLIFNSGATKYWKVFLNTGSAFSTSATNWSMPAGGEKYNGTDYSFRAIGYATGAVDDLGSQSWTVMDMNGDHKLDLVVYNENQTAGDELIPGSGSNKYWKVYLNGGVLSSPEQELQASLLAYPNPVNELLYVKAGAAVLGKSFSIFDGNGRMVLSGKLSNEINTIDMSGVSRGIYFLKVDGEGIALKVVKR